MARSHHFGEPTHQAQVPVIRRQNRKEGQRTGCCLRMHSWDFTSVRQGCGDTKLSSDAAVVVCMYLHHHVYCKCVHICMSVFTQAAERRREEPWPGSQAAWVQIQCLKTMGCVTSRKFLNLSVFWHPRWKNGSWDPRGRVCQASSAALAKTTEQAEPRRAATLLSQLLGSQLCCPHHLPSPSKFEAET